METSGIAVWYQSVLRKLSVLFWKKYKDCLPYLNNIQYPIKCSLLFARWAPGRTRTSFRLLRLITLVCEPFPEVRYNHHYLDIKMPVQCISFE